MTLRWGNVGNVGEGEEGMSIGNVMFGADGGVIGSGRKRLGQCN
jgi:hypothetical protein